MWDTKVKTIFKVTRLKISFTWNGCEINQNWKTMAKKSGLCSCLPLSHFFDIQKYPMEPPNIPYVASRNTLCWCQIEMSNSVSNGVYYVYVCCCLLNKMSEWKGRFLKSHWTALKNWSSFRFIDGLNNSRHFFLSVFQFLLQENFIWISQQSSVWVH